MEYPVRGRVPASAMQMLLRMQAGIVANQSSTDLNIFNRGFMKRNGLLTFVLVIASWSSILRGQEYNVVERGPHHSVWSRVSAETNAASVIVHRTNSFVELASGLNRLQNGQWIAAAPEIEIVNGRGVGRGASHEAIFKANINSTNAIQIRTREGHWLKGRIFGLVYNDRAAQTNVLFATLKDSIGEIVGSNTVIYADAFTAVKADVRYTYKRAGVAQDIVFREIPPTPQSFGLNPATTHLMVLTEFTEAPNPAITTRQWPSETEMMEDEVVKFGSMRMGRGHAFGMKDGVPSKRHINVGKRWITAGGRKFLAERVRYSEIRRDLNELQDTIIVATNGSASVTGKVRWFAEGKVPEALPPSQADDRPIQKTISAAQYKGSDVFVMDYEFVEGYESWYFYCENTYLVSDQVHLLEATFEPDAVIKYEPWGSLYIDGPVSWSGASCNGNTYTIFTSVNDDTEGDWIEWSSGYPETYGPALAVWPQYYSLATSRADVRYASPGIIANLSTVTVSATDTTATKGGDTGKFRIARNGGDWGQALTVQFTVGGSASAPGDYTSIGTSAQIPQNVGYVDVTVTPAAAGGNVFESTVILTVAANANYHVGSPASASVKVYDPSVPPPLAVTAPSDLIAWWPGENNANDRLGNNNGTIFGNVAFNYGKVGQGFEFHNVLSERVKVTSSSALNFGTSTDPNADFSLEGWIRIEAGGIQTIVDKREAPSSNDRAIGYAWYVFNGKLAAQLADAPMQAGNHSSFNCSQPDMRDGSFHHVALTVDRDSSTGLKMYVDGVLRGEFNPGARPGSLANSYPFRIGNHANEAFGGAFKGIIDEVSLYGRALSQNEIQNIYNAGRGGKFVDTDSDGLHDPWELQYFGNLNSLADGDTDCDGLSHLQEYQGGTRPNVGNSPVIQTQPQPKDVCAESSVTFTVVPTGSVLGSYEFQWKRNGVNISGATSSSYTVASVDLEDAGNYTVVVESCGGEVTSSQAALEVNLCTPVTFPNFADVSLLQINGDAEQENTALDGAVLQLTPSLTEQAGSAFLKVPMRLQNNGSFSTYFAFRLTAPGGSWLDEDCVLGADGITFTVQSVGKNALGGTGGNLGCYLGMEGVGIDHSFSVEFDTWYSDWVPGQQTIDFDPRLPQGQQNDCPEAERNIPTADANHVELAFDGRFNFVNGQYIPIAFSHVNAPMNDGNIWYAWIDYNGATEQLEVRLNQAPNRPASPKLAYNFRALDHLTSADAYVGFTGGTGPIFNQQDILFWEMKPYYAPIDHAVNHAPRVNAGPDRRIALGTSATGSLNGTVNDDGIGGTVTPTWTKVSGPNGATVEFTSVNSPVTPATFSAGGKYVLKLTATEATGGLSGEDTMTVTVIDLRSRTFTRNVDFEQGSLLNVNYYALPNALQLNSKITPYPYVNIACTARGTVARIDANTGQVIGEYRTAPANLSHLSWKSVSYNCGFERKHLGRKS